MVKRRHIFLVVAVIVLSALVVEAATPCAGFVQDCPPIDPIVDHRGNRHGGAHGGDDTHPNATVTVFNESVPANGTICAKTIAGVDVILSDPFRGIWLEVQHSKGEPIAFKAPLRTGTYEIFVDGSKHLSESVNVTTQAPTLSEPTGPSNRTPRPLKIDELEERPTPTKTPTPTGTPSKDGRLEPDRTAKNATAKIYSSIAYEKFCDPTANASKPGNLGMRKDQCVAMENPIEEVEASIEDSWQRGEVRNAPVSRQNAYLVYASIYAIFAEDENWRFDEEYRLKVKTFQIVAAIETNTTDSQLGHDEWERTNRSPVK